MQQELERQDRLGVQCAGHERNVRAGAVLYPGLACFPGPAGRRPLTGGDLSPDRGDVLIKLRDDRHSACRSSLECGLPDVSGQPERSRRQRNGTVYHIYTIPAIYD